jgi:hypothetical protein
MTNLGDFRRGTFTPGSDASNSGESLVYSGYVFSWSSSLTYSADPSSKKPEDFQLASEKESVALRDGDAIKQHLAERQFAEPFWPMERVLLWIAFRDHLRWFEFQDPVRFDYNFVSAVCCAKAYDSKSLRDKNPRRTLLQALRSGMLPAFKNGAKLPLLFWADVGDRRWPTDVQIPRQNILKSWPVDESALVIEKDPPRPGTAKLNGEARRQAIRNALKTAIDNHALTGGKKLNGKQQVTEAMKILRRQGVEARRAEVERIADAEFKKHRNPIGVTWKSRRAII